MLGQMLGNLRLSSICLQLQTPLCNSLSTFALPRNCNFLGNTQNNSVTTAELRLNLVRHVGLDVVFANFGEKTHPTDCVLKCINPYVNLNQQCNS